MPRPLTWSLIAASLLTGGAGVVWFGNDVALALESTAPSRAIGTPGNGRLENGKRLPTTGPNFRAYSRLAVLLGRASVHVAVRAAALDAYAQLAAEQPELRFVYGETGWPGGGRFRPHRTHQNGLSVDFMVPVRRRDGRVAELPTSPWLEFGYAIQFDSLGRYRDLTIDFEAVVEHLRALDVAAARHGLAIERVILAPEFHGQLGTSEEGRTLLGRLPFVQREVWVRHDEHYHVDFRSAAP